MRRSSHLRSLARTQGSRLRGGSVQRIGAYQSEGVVGLQQLAQRHAASSFTGAFLDAVTPSSLKNAVKSSLLDEATREDSRIWSSNERSAVKPQQHVNGHSRKVVVNGDHNDNHVNQTTLVSGAHENPLDDPLDDLYEPGAALSTRYWPHLPPQVNPHVDPFALAKVELDSLSQSIREDLIRTDHPVLNKAAAYFFDAAADGGKKVRPMMVLLLSRALSDTAGHEAPPQQPHAALLASPLAWQRSDLAAAQRRLAEISEMIHTASLFHDDVIDGADTRRGVPSVHMVFGNKMAILAGDYLLARASISLARLRNVEVVETMSTIIEHLVRGEVMQMRGSSSSSTDQSGQNVSGDDRMNYYLKKNFYKTGSLMANSCRSAALLGHYSPELVSASYRFGKHVGMAFQLVDDVLDFEGSLASLGKPALSDLKAGLTTAPVLFAAQEIPQLWTLVDRKFAEAGDVDQAVEWVQATSAMEQTKQLARIHAERAMDAVLERFEPSPHRDALVLLANKVVARTK